MNPPIVYGTPSGVILLLEVPTRIVPPPTISGCPMLGTVSDMATALNYHEKQSRTAAAIGVTQQEVSRWVIGSSETRKPERIKLLAQRYIELCLQAPDHIHNLEMYRANAHVDRRKE